LENQRRANQNHTCCWFHHQRAYRRERIRYLPGIPQSRCPIILKSYGRYQPVGTEPFTLYK
jgi:hypothetical protein